MVNAGPRAAVCRRKPVPSPTRWIAPLLAWYARHARDLPWRRTQDPYAIWISEIMLQQTQVKTVIPYWERWLRELPDVWALAAAPEDRVLKLWEGLGYYTRARNLQRAARLIVNSHHGEFPQQVDALLELPGVGRYTAGAIASIAFNQPAPILDGNVMRVLTRLCAWPGDPREPKLNARLWTLAEQLVSKASHPPHLNFVLPPLTGACSALNQALMELGAMVCTPRLPACPACPLAAFCEARRLGRVEEFPTKPQRIASIPQRRVVAVLERAGRLLMSRRGTGTINARLWEFPSLQLQAGDEPIQAAAKWLAISSKRFAYVSSISHSITRYRIRLEVYRTRADRIPVELSNGCWIRWSELDSLPLTSAHRRIARVLAGA